MLLGNKQMGGNKLEICGSWNVHIGFSFVRTHLVAIFLGGGADGPAPGKREAILEKDAN